MAPLDFEAIGKADTEFGTPLALFEAALKHDFGSEVFLQWYVTEQIEEESNAQGIIDQLRLVGDDSNGLLLIDRDLANRQPDAGE